MSLSQLPNELVLEIVRHVDFSDLRRWVLVARRYHWLLMSEIYNRAVSRTWRIASDWEVEGQERERQIPLGPLYYLVRAATLSNLSAFRALLERTKDIDNPDTRPPSDLYSYGECDVCTMSLLHFVCFRGEVEMTRALLEAGATITVKADRHQTPLHYAARRGQISTAAVLLQAGADPAAVDKRRTTPLHLACACGHTPLVRLMLDRGADISTYSPFYPGPPLFHAVKSGNRETVRLIVDAGADIAFRSQAGLTVLHAAAQCRAETDIMALVIDLGADPYARTETGHTALHLVSNAGAARILLDRAPGLVACQNKNGCTPLQKNYRLPWFRDSEDVGLSLLAMSASQLPGTQLVIDIFSEAAYHGSTKIVSWLLETYGASVLGRDSSKGTPLHSAARSGNTTIVSWLLETYGASVLELGLSGRTPLHTAARYGNAVVVKQLLSAGIKPNVRCVYGQTALHSAAITYDDTARKMRRSLSTFVEALLDATSFEEPVYETAKQQGSIPVIKVLLRLGLGVRRWDSYGRSVLRSALTPVQS